VAAVQNDGVLFEGDAVRTVVVDGQKGAVA
jgi:hypothetical protein